MADSTLTLGARLALDSRRWVQGLDGARKATKSFADGARREVDHLRRTMGSLPGVLASITAGWSAVEQVRKSANLDQVMTRIGQNASTSRGEIEKMRASLKNMAKETGASMDDLTGGLDVLIAGNLDPDRAVTVLREINKEARITGAGMGDLGKALMVMDTNFGVNLNSGTAVLEMLEKMTVAGRQGFVELENLANVIPKIAQPAKMAGMNADSMLAFAETLSQAEPDPERLGTLAESTLRIFNNPQYRKKIRQVTGVKFTDAHDELRPVQDVFTDLQKSYSKLKTSGERQRFMGAVFGQMDITTQTGVQSMLGKGQLADMASKLSAIQNARGQVASDLPGAMDNSVAQSAVLRATLQESLDNAARPVNKAISEAIKFATSPDGLNLSGNQMLGYGAAGLAGTYAATRALPPALQKLFGSGTSLGTGIVMGHALENAGAATPVYVVNMPGEGLGGGVAPAAGGKGAGAIGAAAMRALPYVAMTAVAADPRNQNLGADAIARLRTETGGRKAWDWARRDGMPLKNLLQDLFGSKARDTAAAGQAQQVDLRIAVTDERVALRGVRSNSGGVTARVSSPNSRGGTGRMMQEARH